MNPYQFFLKHAGYSYDPKTQTPMQGRVQSARRLAAAERKARDAGYSFRWQADSDVTFACYCLAPPKMQEQYYGVSPDVVTSLHGIDCGNEADPYRRVVEAELALEALDNLKGQL